MMPDARRRVAEDPKVRASDVVAFVVATWVGVVVALVFTALTLPLVPFGILAGRRGSALA